MSEERIPRESLISCVKRELEHRAYTYPARVARGTMPAEEARAEVLQMQEVLRVLEELPA